MAAFDDKVLLDAPSWSEGIKRYKDDKTRHHLGGKVEKPVRMTHYFKKREERLVNPILQTYSDATIDAQIRSLEHGHMLRTINKAYDTQIAAEQKFDILNHQPRKGHVWEVEYKQTLKPPSLVTVGHTDYNIISNLKYQEHHWAEPGKRPPTEQPIPRKPPFLSEANKPRDYDITNNMYKQFHAQRTKFEADQTRASILDTFGKTRVFDPIKVQYYDESREAEYHVKEKRDLLARGKNHIQKYPPTYQKAPSTMYDIVSLETKDAERLETVLEKEKRLWEAKAAERVGREEVNKQQQDRHADAEVRRKMNRISYKPYADREQRGFDILSNNDFDKVGLPARPHARPQQTLQAHFLKQERERTCASQGPSHAGPNTCSADILVVGSDEANRQDSPRSVLRDGWEGGGRGRVTLTTAATSPAPSTMTRRQLLDSARVKNDMASARLPLTVTSPHARDDEAGANMASEGKNMTVSSTASLAKHLACRQTTPCTRTEPRVLSCTQSIVYSLSFACQHLLVIVCERRHLWHLTMAPACILLQMCVRFEFCVHACLHMVAYSTLGIRLRLDESPACQQPLRRQAQEPQR
jgi:hypothetical protein